MSRLRLGVNIDHVATLRNARGSPYPDPLRAAKAALAAGADIITAHLREDRRHIRDEDIANFTRNEVPLNLEMAATDEMVEIAFRTKPHACCIVPERREERTTEGGIDVAGPLQKQIRGIVHGLSEAFIRVSLFIEPDRRQIEAAHAIGAHAVELHTGAYCGAARKGVADRHLKSLREAAREATRMGLEVHAGHGLTYDNAGPIAAIPEIVELQIGHFLMGEAVFTGLDAAIKRMRAILDKARGT